MGLYNGKNCRMTSKSNAAARFTRTRAAHRSELAEDYVEVILELIEEDGDARLTEIATRVGVAHPTASKSLKKLEREGLVKILPYRSIELTESGKTLACSCRRRHEIVVQFLCNLGVDRQTAETDAEGIEHHVSPKTLRLMEGFRKRR